MAETLMPAGSGGELSKETVSRPSKSALSGIAKKVAPAALAAMGVLGVAGKADAQWKDPAYPADFGQTGGNFSPFVVWKDALNARAVFTTNDSSIGPYDIRCAKSIDGGHTFQTLTLDDSSLSNLVKVNNLWTNNGAALRWDSGSSTWTLLLTSSRDGTGDVFQSQNFDIDNCIATSNVTKLPSGGANVNGDTTNEVSVTVDPLKNDKIYILSTASGGGLKPHVADIGVWIKSLVPGVAPAGLQGGMAAWGNYMAVGAASNCNSVGSSIDLCRMNFDGTTASGAVNFNEIPGMLTIPNDAQYQSYPMVDVNGNLWYTSGTAGAQKIMRKDPVSVSQVCGNSTTEGTEQCDDGVLNGVPCTPPYGTSCNYCSATCTTTNVPMQQWCGEGVRNGPEACDGSDLAGQNCATLGFQAGPGLACDVSCNFDTTNCAPLATCGDGPCNGTETCSSCPQDCGTCPDGGAGQGGSGGAGPCAVEVTGSLEKQSCDANGAVVLATGPGTAKMGDKTLTINEVVNPCTYTLTMPNIVKLNSGDCGTKISEPNTTVYKYFDGHYGDEMGAEGSEKEVIIPAELNPRKAQGQVDIVGYKINSATHIIWADQGCEPDNLPACQPRDIMVPGATKKGELPEGTILYKRKSDGMLTVNPADFNVTPPATTPETGDDGGCSIANIDDGVNGTRGNLAPILMALGIAAGLVRRKGFKGVEVKAA